MGEDGACYEITKYPEYMDIMGVLPKSEQKDPRSDSQPDLNRPRTSTNPGKLSPSLEELFSDLKDETDKGESEVEDVEDHKKSLREIKVTKVFQDEPLKDVYQDSLETYYATTKIMSLELSVTHVILVEQFGRHYNRIRDK